MAFDPDAYLAEDDFNPDEYLGAPAPEEKALLRTVADAALEGMAAVNRGAAGIVDFAASPVNAALELAGSDARIPSAVAALSPATTGNFMQEGLGRDVVRAAGETVPAALAVGGALRTAANQLPSMASGAESIGAGALRQMGQSTMGADAGYAALSGAGSAAGGELGEMAGGDTGRQVGAMAGSIAAPLAGAVVAQAPSAISSRLANSQEASLIKEAAPTIDRLKSSAREVYKEIDDLGAVVNSGRINFRVDSSIESFTLDCCI